MNPVLEDVLMHYGMKYRSGRYPYGSGEEPYQHDGNFLGRVKQYRDENVEFTDPETGKKYTGDTAIAKIMGMSTTQFRYQYSIALNEKKNNDATKAQSMRDDGKTLTEIAEALGYPGESSIRSLLNQKSVERRTVADNIADKLREEIKTKGMIDVGAGVELQLGVTRDSLDKALTILANEGYPIYGRGVQQVTNPTQQTHIQVLCTPGTEHKDIYDNTKIHALQEDWVSHDGGETFDPKFVYPKSMDSKRMMVRYAEDGGLEKDGLIEIRRNVPDLNLGESRYAQVRILVDNDLYMKGMAVYSDNMPDGVDVVFNTNKAGGTPLNKVLKETKKEDPNNPFGSLIKPGIVDPDHPDDPDNYRGGQSYYYDKDGKKQLSLINKRAEEGDWDEWAKKLPAQFLSKQSMKLINQQLSLAKQDKDDEFNEIMSLTNNTVKKSLLDSFAEDCDSAAEHLQAAALPRQRYQVIIPLNDIKDNEVYAPNYKNGETVALVRYPHGGTFEIPILKVNNKNREGIDVLSLNALDAVGINSKVAGKLSGADFDGDTVMVIPCNSPTSSVKITSTPTLKGLENFEPKEVYGGKKEGTFKPLLKSRVENEMGQISNLITDMTLKGATNEELARAVRHSMVVIDAHKHKLDYKQSEIDNDIKSLKDKYQGHYNEDGKYSTGASTLISRAKGEKTLPFKRVGTPRVDENGDLVYKEVVEYYPDKKTGKMTLRTTKSTQMAETKDARTLVSDRQTKQELAYADYANHMKDLARKARLESKATPDIKYSASAKAVYLDEYNSLTAKLNNSKKNAPKERMAQMIAGAEVAAIRKDNPDMTKGEVKKIRARSLQKARAKVGAKREPVHFTDKEWDAIQAGAVSANILKGLMQYGDSDEIRQRATPRTRTTLSDAKQAKIRSMKAMGRTNSEIADALGVSVSTVTKYSK